jgi:deazaflavin-dependent oxidoreductase (nitroreductase family)
MNTGKDMEREFFRILNGVVEPAVTAGLGSPGLNPWGMVTLETIGRRTGTPRSVPLAGLVVGECVIVSTIRGSCSEWVNNVRADDRVRYWLLGQPIDGIATIIDATTSAESVSILPVPIKTLVRMALEPAILTGWTFAVLQPRKAGDAGT